MSKKVEKLLEVKRQDVAKYLAKGYKVKMHLGTDGRIYLVAYDRPNDNSWIEENW